VITIDNLVVRYGAVVALRGVSLEVQPGEAVSVVGPNGAGKTSLLRCIAGSFKAASGSISLDGWRLEGKAAHTVSRRGVVLVPEGRAILAPLTVRQNLQMGGYTKPKAEVKARIDEMCALFPVLGRRLDSPGGLLSGGEQQMLAIARGLMADPRLLMLDEPSMGLAPKIVDNILEALKQVAGRGTSILLAEQNAALALDVTDRAYVLVGGEIVASGAGDEVGEDLLGRYLA
jgi:branched-chain amino acid transport system ATP-binding protein